MERLDKLEKEGWELTHKMQSQICDVIKERGGHINLLEIRKKKDYYPTPIYAYVLDEDRDEYREAIINEIKVEDDDNERYLCVKVEFRDNRICAAKENDKWYDVVDGIVLSLPTMLGICESLKEYTD